MAQETWTKWVCSDCMVLMANGETPPEMSEEETEAWLAKIENHGHTTIGLMREEHECDYDQDWHSGHCTCETREFSWDPCDSCGSRLGGSRHAVTLWEDEA